MSHTYRSTAVVLAAASLLLTGGIRVGASQGTTAKPTLAGTSWRLVEFQSMDDAVGRVQPTSPSLYTMRLNPDGMALMRLNCNRAQATWSMEPGSDGSSGRFAFGPVAATRALCPPPSMDERIATDVSFVRSYVIKDARLYLSLMADAGIYVWEPYSVEPVAPEDGGPRLWEVTVVSGVVNMRSEPSTTGAVVARHPSGTILDNLGCQRASDRVWCDVQTFGGGPRGYVAAEFLKPAISPDGAVATGPDLSALRAGQGQFDATGSLPCAQSAGQPTAPCAFGVARAGGGFATVVVKRPDGRQRAIFFRNGIATGADDSEADRTGPFTVSREGDLHIVRVGTERYEIPDAVVFGG